MLLPGPSPHLLLPPRRPRHAYELVHPVPGRDGHERERGPRQRLELGPDADLEPDVARPQVRDLGHGRLPADGVHQAAHEEEQRPQEGEQHLAEDELAAALAGEEEQARQGAQDGEPREAGAGDVDGGEGLEDLREGGELVLELLGDAQVGEADVEGPDAELFVEEAGDVHRGCLGGGGEVSIHLRSLSKAEGRGCMFPRGYGDIAE